MAEDTTKKLEPTPIKKHKANIVTFWASKKRKVITGVDFKGDPVETSADEIEFEATQEFTPNDVVEDKEKGEFVRIEEHTGYPFKINGLSFNKSDVKEARRWKRFGSSNEIFYIPTIYRVQKGQKPYKSQMTSMQIKNFVRLTLKHIRPYFDFPKSRVTNRFDWDNKNTTAFKIFPIVFSAIWNMTRGTTSKDGKWSPSEKSIELVKKTLGTDDTRKVYEFINKIRVIDNSDVKFTIDDVIHVSGDVLKDVIKNKIPFPSEFAIKHQETDFEFDVI